MHLVIYFSGTGSNTKQFEGCDYIPSDSNVKLIVVEGCQHKEVCDGDKFPDLKGFAKRFTSQLFNFKKDKNVLNLTTSDLQNLKIGITENIKNRVKTSITKERKKNIENITSFQDKEKDKDKNITGITLCGYSRGAVTCFNVARELKKICPAIPVDIVANQPVSGNVFAGPFTNAADIGDCSDLTNLRNVSIILGAYTGQAFKKLKYKNPIMKTGHRAVLSQIVPKLPQSLKDKKKIIVIPRTHHNDSGDNTPSGSAHCHMEIAKSLAENKYIQIETVAAKTKEARETYFTVKDILPGNFPSAYKLQPVFGIENEELYNHIDVLHPTPHLRQGFEWTSKKQSLKAWWDRHEEKASNVFSLLTKNLIKEINKFDEDKEKLINLFKTADKWLIIKSNSNSSRYQQVEALRNNIFYELVTHNAMQEADLRNLSSQHLHENKFFKKRWENLGKNASWRTSDETTILNTAFDTYATQKILSKAADEDLLKALNDWIDVKDERNSKRYAIALDIRNSLQKAIKNTIYEQEKPENPTPEEPVTFTGISPT